MLQSAPASKAEDTLPAAGRAAAAAAFQTFTQLLKELSSSNTAGRVLLTRSAPEAVGTFDFCGTAPAAQQSSTNKGGQRYDRHQLSAAVGAAAAPAQSSSSDAQIKYVLLDASSKFADTLAAARSVILTSGTLSPLELLTAQLCPTQRFRHQPTPAHAADNAQSSDTTGAAADARAEHSNAGRQMHVFRCGHVVASERVLATGVSKGPGGLALRLTHGARGHRDVLDECGRVLLELCKVVPQGLVAFVPSFAYADTLRARCASRSETLCMDGAAVPVQSVASLLYLSATHSSQARYWRCALLPCCQRDALLRVAQL